MNNDILLNPNRAKLIIWVKKIIALGLIIYPLYYLYLSTIDLIFVFPKISYLDNATGESLYLNLIKRAVIISTGLFFNTLYGFSLLIKPGSSTKIAHLVFGVILFLISHFLFESQAINQLIKSLEFFPLT